MLLRDEGILIAGIFLQDKTELEDKHQNTKLIKTLRIATLALLLRHPFEKVAEILLSKNNTRFEKIHQLFY